jgi:CDP-diacylglycerol pyrophosphatase
MPCEVVLLRVDFSKWLPLPISLFTNLHVTRNITVKFLEVWNKFNNFGTLVTIATSAILNFTNTRKASTRYGEYSYDVS